MPGNAKNPANPHAPAVDALSEFNLQIILEYIEHRGGPAKIASLSIGKIPGLLPVIYYIDHERGCSNHRSDVFDFFHLDRPKAQLGAQEDPQDLVYTLDDSDESAAAQASPGRTVSPPEPIASLNCSGLIGAPGLFAFHAAADTHPFTM
ncbi:hypothetical protein [Comamonas antarctica]|uniref:hypothetical protein n=1 Tax=Comamonas antarctica TaxID=2743470 RepID=UPI0028E7C81A|nr:hypothetical protein [Comamonas antarctica]